MADLATRLNSLHHRIIVALWQHRPAKQPALVQREPVKKSGQPLERRKNGRINSDEIASPHAIMA